MNAISTESFYCPDMISGAITYDSIFKIMSDFGLYTPSFMRDVLAKITNTDITFIYLKKGTHAHLEPYHHKWETLIWILLHNAQDEDKGGTRIYKRAKELEQQKYPDIHLIKQMKKHVSDEKRHARLFMKAAQLVSDASHMKIIDNEDNTVGQEIVNDLLTHVPMSLFKMMAAIYSIEFRSYFMIMNTLKSLIQKAGASKILYTIVDVIKSIPADEKYHVEYTAKFLEKSLDRARDDYSKLIEDIVESFVHTGTEMHTYMEIHAENIEEEGGLSNLTTIA